MGIAPEWIDTLQKDEIIVVGTNWKGIHGAGAAKYAFDHCGLSWGRSLGQFGQSFGIPTKDFAIKSLPLDEIKEGVDFFIGFSQTNFGKKFKYKVTAIGTGYAGYTIEQIAPMFKEALNKENIYLPKSFIDVLQS